jgi:hypothetical protein
LNERAVKFALARGIAAASPIASYEALRGLDPILRLLAVRKIRRLLARAERETALREPEHLLRVAYLLAGKMALQDADQPEQVRKECAAVPAPESLGRRARWLSPSVIAAIGCLAISGLLRHRLTRPFSPRESAAGLLLGGELTHAVVGLSNGNQSELASARESLTGARAQKVLGANTTRELTGLVANMVALRSAELASARPRVDDYLASIVGLDRALERAQQPFFVDGEMRSSEAGVLPIPMSYYVQREVQVTDGTNVVRALWLWRLDDLSLRQGLLGFTRPNTPAALILLDQLETDLVHYILPGAAIDGLVELVDEPTREKGEPWAIEIEASATELVRGYYRGLGAPLGVEAAHIGSLLSRRRSLVRKWQAALRGQGFEFRIPDDFLPKADYSAQLELRIARNELEEWDELHAELRERAMAFEALRDRFARGIERHEIQHRLDYARGLIAVPPFLCRLLGLDSPIAENPTSVAARARDEASAYLAELARADDSPVLETILLAHFMLDREVAGSPYTYAALQVYASLGVALGLDLDDFLGTHGVSRSGFSRLALAIWAHSPAELKAAAAQGFETDYGAKLADVRQLSARDNRRYRP